MTIQVAVLGHSRVLVPDGSPHDPAPLVARKPRSVLAALVLHLDSGVSADRLVELVWGDHPPKGAHATLQAYVSGLRRSLEPGLGPRERPRVLVTTDTGYRLLLPREQVDATSFADEVRARHRVLAPLGSQLTTGPDASWPTRAEIAGHVEALEQALAAWDGTAYADLPDHLDVIAERSALDQLRRTAEEDRALALLALGEHATVVAATEQATARTPWAERTWALHALALVRAGRQRDALAALRRVREVLAEELGLDPSQELRDLEQAVLRQDPALQTWLGQSVPQPRSAPPATTPSSPQDRRAAQVSTRGWDTVGREPEREAIASVLTTAAGGRPVMAEIVGEAGIGKSRLVDYAVELAREEGFEVTTARCSHDVGAPPLWPWQAVIRDLGDLAVAEELATARAAGADDIERAFATWDRLAQLVRSRAAESPLLMVVEDSHWADASSARALAHLVATVGEDEKLALLVTRRPWPEPTGPRAALGEQLARRHVVRLEPAGLGIEEARALVGAVASSGRDAVSEESLAGWLERSGGNPFFLVELARSAGLDRLGVPATVRQVVLGRVAALPERTQDLLVLAAVLGGTFSIEVLALVDGTPVEEVDEALAPARESGLLHDADAAAPHLLAFDHSLTREAVLSSVSASARARLHARVAHALDTDERVAGMLAPAELVAELARHWLAAGSSHSGRAWQAAAAAAEQLRASFAHEDAATLMGAALDAQQRDPASRRQDRFELLLIRAADAQRAASWVLVVECCFEAIELARAGHDPVRVSQAAAELSHNSVWTVHQWQESFPDVIEDLRWALSEVGEDDSQARCRLMLALAVELYYEPETAAERAALADEGMAMARRLAPSTPGLLAWACRAAGIALWVPDTLTQRTAWAHEGLEAARQDRDSTGIAVALTVCAGVAVEAGDLAGYEAHAKEALALGRRQRLSYVVLALTWTGLAIAAMRAQDEVAAEAAAELDIVKAWVSVHSEEFETTVVPVFMALWTEAIQAFADPLLALLRDAPDSFGYELLHLVLAHAGRNEDLLALRPPQLRPLDWGSLFDLACAAQSAFVTGNTAQARLVLDVAKGLEARMAVAGISVLIGPFDGYLALAHATLGQLAEASRLADRADQLADAWALVRYREWLAAHRSDWER